MDTIQFSVFLLQKRWDNFVDLALEHNSSLFRIGLFISIITVKQEVILTPRTRWQVSWHLQAPSCWMTRFFCQIQHRTLWKTMKQSVNKRQTKRVKALDLLPRHRFKTLVLLVHLCSMSSYSWPMGPQQWRRRTGKRRPTPGSQCKTLRRRRSQFA